LFAGEQDEQDDGIEKWRSFCLALSNAMHVSGTSPCSLFSDTKDSETNGDPPDIRASDTAAPSTPLVSKFVASRYGIQDVLPGREISAITRAFEHEIQLSK